MTEFLGDGRPGRAAIRDLVIQILLDAVPEVAGRIYSARAWPMAPEGLPALLVYAFRERKVLLSTAGGPPDYAVTASLAVHARAEGETEAEAEGWLDVLAGAVEDALLRDADFVARFERIPSVTTEIQLLPGGDRPVGEAVLVFDLEWTERFDPTLPYQLQRASLRGDAVEPADLTGTYPPSPPFPDPAPAPRGGGPDGRAEIGADLTIL